MLDRGAGSGVGLVEAWVWFRCGAGSGVGLVQVWVWLRRGAGSCVVWLR